jgi:hypothetical protein
MATAPGSCSQSSGKFGNHGQDVIGMVKKTSKIHYEYNGHSRDVKAIYRQFQKLRGRTKIVASALVTLKGGQAGVDSSPTIH